MKTIQLLLYTFITFLLLVSCGKDNPSSTEPEPPAPPGNPNTVSKDIGADGGEIISSDGLLTLTIPQGALGNTETISITPVEANDLGSEFDEIEVEKAYELAPDGLVFESTITVEYQVQNDDQNDSLDVTFPGLLTVQEGEALALANLVYDGEKITGQLNHFSPLVVETRFITAIVRNLPAQLEVGQNVFLEIEVRINSGIFGESYANPPGGGTGGVIYKDANSTGNDEFKFMEATDLVALEPSFDGEVEFFHKSVAYSCVNEGIDVYLGTIFGNQVKKDAELDTVSSFYVDLPSMGQNELRVECVPEYLPKFTLIANLDGDGFGSVSSNPAGIDCPDDCEEEYEEGAKVTLTATPDEGSEFTEWSGDFDFGSNDSNSPTIQLTMDQARTVTATFEMEQPTGGFLQLGMFTLPVLTNPETIVVLGGPEQAFANLPEGSVPALVQGAEGFIVIDLKNGEVLLDFTGLPNNGSVGERTPLGALGISRPNPGPNTLALIASYGQDNNNTEFGFNVFPYDIQNQSFIKGPLSPLPSTIHAFSIGGKVISNEIGMVREGGFGINFIRYNEISDEYVFRPSSEILGSNRYGFEQPVTAYGENVEGALLVVNEPGDLYYEPRVGLTPTTLVGNLGQRIIRIECEIPVCGATDNDANKVLIILWDGESPPSIIGDPVTVGLGPVDLHLYRLSNGNTLIVTTGFNDNTITEIEVDVNGDIVNTSIYDLPEECIAPGHAVFADNPDDSNNPFIIGTCYDTDIYFINDSFNTSGWSLNAGIR